MVSTKDSTGALVTLAKNDKITSINGLACEYYVSSVEPRDAADKKPYLKTWPIKIRSTDLSAGAIVLGTEKTIAGQVKYVKAEEITAAQGPNAPVTRGHFLCRNADVSTAPLIKVVFADAPEAQVYPDLFTVKMVTVTYTGADDDAGIPGSSNEVPLTLACKEVDMTEQVLPVNGQATLMGDARIVFAQNLATMAQIKAASHFTIKPQTGSEERFTIFGEEGIKVLPNFHYEVFLRRQQ